MYLTPPPRPFRNDPDVARQAGVKSKRLKRDLGPGAQVRYSQGYTSAGEIDWHDGTVVEMWDDPENGLTITVRDDQRGVLHHLYEDPDEGQPWQHLDPQNLVVTGDAAPPDSVGAGDTVEFDLGRGGELRQGRVVRVLRGRGHSTAPHVRPLIETRAQTIDVRTERGRLVRLTPSRAGGILRVVKDARGEGAEVAARTPEKRRVRVLDPRRHVGLAGLLSQRGSICFKRVPVVRPR